MMNILKVLMLLRLQKPKIFRNACSTQSPNVSGDHH
jgi:hypothetical protein